MLAAQVRVFDPHLSGVIGKGTLLPLSSSALPPGTIILRQSQVKAPAGKAFWSAWTRHWQDLLIWAHQQHLQQANTQMQPQVSPPQHLWTLPQRQHSAVAGASGTSSSSAGSSCGIHAQSSAGATATPLAAFEAAAAAAAAAAASGPKAATLRCFNAQDQPWMQQVWYIHNAMRLAQQAAAAAGPASAQGSFLPPARPGCPSSCQQQQQHQCWTACSSNMSGSSSGSVRACGCSAVLEVVSRPPDSSGRNPDLKVNKNLLLLLHHAGVPAEVFAE